MKLVLWNLTFEILILTNILTWKFYFYQIIGVFQTAFLNICELIYVLFKKVL